MAGGVLTTPTLRAAIMSIGTTEGRHLTALYLLQGLVPVPLSIFSTAKAAPPDSYIGPNGPVKPLNQLPTPTTAAPAPDPRTWSATNTCRAPSAHGG